MAVGGRRRPWAAAGGLATMGAAVLARFAVFEAGKASALDPRYVAGPQRERLDRREEAPGMAPSASEAPGPRS